MNKAKFMERLCRFNVPTCVTAKYHEIYERMANAAELSASQIKDRVARLAFAGYIARGTQLITSDSDVEVGLNRCKLQLCKIPVLPDANLVNMHTVRHSRPANDLQQIAIVHIYVEPAEDGTPCLTIADVAAQLSQVDAARAKAFALRLKDDFVETGYLHLAQAYEFQIELFA